MTQEEFIKELKKRSYSYEIEGDEILVTHQGNVWLDSLKSLPPGVRFKNQEGVDLGSLKSLPPGVRFQNQGDVWLESLETLPPGVRFENRGNVLLRSLVGGWVEYWKGNIKGVNPKRLLNLMIDKGVFV